MFIYSTGQKLMDAGCEDAVRKADGTVTTRIGKISEEYPVRPQYGNSGWYIIWTDDTFTDPEGKLPEVIETLATSFSFVKNHVWIGKRKPGIYHHGTARAEVEFDTTNRELWTQVRNSSEAIHNIQITCEKLADGQELYRLLMSGQILPEPETDWLRPQMTAPKPEAEEEGI